MKLVEILAREWFEWPINHDGPLAQNAHGGIYIPGSFRADGFDAGLCMSVKQADDWRIALVARAQWEEERARILLESQPQRDHFIQEITESASDDHQLERDYDAEYEKHYEQELWDKVASNCYGKYTHKNADRQKCAHWAFADADAFMAERAKRLKK